MSELSLRAADNNGYNKLSNCFVSPERVTTTTHTLFQWSCLIGWPIMTSPYWTSGKVRRRCRATKLQQNTVLNFISISHALPKQAHRLKKPQHLWKVSSMSLPKYRDAMTHNLCKMSNANFKINWRKNAKRRSSTTSATVEMIRKQKHCENHWWNCFPKQTYLH